jgi:hypothetical protein
MTSNTRTDFVEEQQAWACVDQARDSDVRSFHASSARDIFTGQTGQALITLGKIFVNVPPFNDHIDRSTGQLLISLGKKLKNK